MQNKTKKYKTKNTKHVKKQTTKQKYNTKNTTNVRNLK